MNITPWTTEPITKIENGTVLVGGDSFDGQWLAALTFVSRPQPSGGQDGGGENLAAELEQAMLDALIRQTIEDGSDELARIDDLIATQPSKQTGGGGDEGPWIKAGDTNSDDEWVEIRGVLS